MVPDGPGMEVAGVVEGEGSLGDVLGKLSKSMRSIPSAYSHSPGTLSVQRIKGMGRERAGGGVDVDKGSWKGGQG